MGDFGLGAGYDVDFSQLGSDTGDVAQPGAGADPFGGGYDPGADYSSSDETASIGALPGGTDSQYSPFSPNGGFDFTDVTRNIAALSTPARGLVGPGGFFYDTTPSGPARPNLGVQPMPAPGGSYSAANAGAIVRAIRQNTGLRVTARSIVGLIVRYGFQAAAALTKAEPGALLTLFMRAKGVRHHRRGPGLYTVARRLRAADRMRATAARILGRGGLHVGRARRPPPFHTMRRSSRRRRR